MTSESKHQEHNRRIIQLFSDISEGYDRANDRLSLGLQKKWKESLVDVALARLPTEGCLLDVCCGTGDILEAVAKARPDIRATGLDLTEPMLEIAQARVKGLDNVRLVSGDAMHIPFPDGEFDLVTVSFGLRNTPDYMCTLKEMARVLKHGGWLLCLDASVPDNPVVRLGFKIYFGLFMPIIGGGIRKTAEYRWLNESTWSFPRKDKLRGMLEAAGLTETGYKGFMLGSCALHWGKRLENTAG